jgi:two-component system cell cycle sensor histidine kinase/response regulator CckA
MNIFANAKDAMEGKAGSIKVETSNLKDLLVIQISDSGCGIPKQDLHKVTDTFYTTKSPGQGTGLGMSIVHSIVESLGGKVEIDSEVGMGTCVTLSFPCLEDSIDLPNKLRGKVRQGKLEGRVLVVDDEDDLREIIIDQVERLGLEVDEASDGDIAFDMIKGKQYQYIITDLKMPRMSGEILLKKTKMLDLNPAPKFIIITGCLITEYSSEQRKTLRELANGYIKKPFSKDEIFTALIECQREYKRITRQLIVRLSSEKEGELSPNSTYDIGQGGVFVCTEKIVRVGSILQFEIVFNDRDNRVIEGIAKVAWVREDDEGDLPRGFGVQFLSLTNEQKHFIDSFVKANL